MTISIGYFTEVLQVAIDGQDGLGMQRQRHLDDSVYTGVIPGGVKPMPDHTPAKLEPECVPAQYAARPDQAIGHETRRRAAAARLRLDGVKYTNHPYATPALTGHDQNSIKGTN